MNSLHSYKRYKGIRLFQKKGHVSNGGNGTKRGFSPSIYPLHKGLCNYCIFVTLGERKLQELQGLYRTPFRRPPVPSPGLAGTRLRGQGRSALAPKPHTLTMKGWLYA